jgi:hypothetical protein
MEQQDNQIAHRHGSQITWRNPPMLQNCEFARHRHFAPLFATVNRLRPACLFRRAVVRRQRSGTCAPRREPER